MQRITMEDFGNIHCLSQLQYAPDGKAAAFVVTRADVKKNEYLSEIWLMEKQQDAFSAPRKLTAGGKESSFLWLDGQNLLFPGDRKKAHEPKPGEAVTVLTASTSTAARPRSCSASR